MELSVHLQNIQHGAVDKNGDRWPLLAQRLGRSNPDVMLLNEALGWTDNDEELLQRAEADLGLTALRPLPPARSGHHVAILYRPETIGAPIEGSYNTDFASQFEHGIAVAAWELGLPRPLAICTTHLSPFSSSDALAEAQKARWTALRYGDRKADDHYYSIIGADFNAPPLFGPPADVSRMNALDRASRFRDAECTVPNTDVAEAFARVGFLNAAEILYGLDHDERHLLRTGRSDRIDWFLVTRRLRRAVVRGGRLDTPARAADHDGLNMVIDTGLIDTSPR